MGQEHLELLSNLFKVNLHFIDGTTRNPYVFGNNQQSREYDYNVVILWIENHFEIIGRIEDDNIKRKFVNDDEFIKIFS
jgi:hypothetical protein